jgi:hypothetical protein
MQNCTGTGTVLRKIPLANERTNLSDLGVPGFQQVSVASEQHHLQQHS